MQAGRIRLGEGSVPPSRWCSGWPLIAAYVSVVLVLVDRTSFDVWGAVLLAPILIGVSVPDRSAAKRRGSPIRAPSACCSWRWS